MAYKNSHTMSKFPDAFGIPEKQQEFVDSVKAQLDNCVPFKVVLLMDTAQHLIALTTLWM